MYIYYNTIIYRVYKILFFLIFIFGTFFACIKIMLQQIFNKRRSEK